MNETIDALSIKPDGVYVDGTAGGGGHSAEILKRLSDKGRLILIDQDPDAIKTVSERFKDCGNVTVCKGNFADMENILGEIGVYGADGIPREVDIGGGKVLTNNVYWTHEGNTDNPDGINLLDGSIHRLNFIGEGGSTNVLWRLNDVRDTLQDRPFRH